MSLEAGLQLHLPTHREASVHELVEVSRAAASAGFDQVWVTDNAECLNLFVVLAAVASRAPVKLGAAIMSQYLHSPMEAASALIAISDWLNGLELTVGIGSGSPSAQRMKARPRPIAFMRETALSLQKLVSGGVVEVKEFPLVGRYFNFPPEATLEMAARGAGPIKFYGGGNGPKGLALAGEVMDGLLFGWAALPFAIAGTLGALLTIAADAARASGRAASFGRAMEVKIAAAPRHSVAREYVTSDRSCPPMRLVRRFGGDESDELATGLRIGRRDVEKARKALASGASGKDLAESITDSMIDAACVAGDVSFCRERIQQVADIARAHGFEQVVFSQVGPNLSESVGLIADAMDVL